jgi:hypothetical protein
LRAHTGEGATVHIRLVGPAIPNLSPSAGFIYAVPSVLTYTGQRRAVADHLLFLEGCLMDARARYHTIVLTLVLFALGDDALACQCGRTPTVTDAAATADMVITGVVLAARPSVVPRHRLRLGLGSDDEMPILFPVTRIDIGVSRVIKGGNVGRVSVTQLGCCMCEELLEVDREYLLFVRRHHSVAGAYMISMCDPNAPISSAGSALIELGRPVYVHREISRSRSLVRRGLDFRDRVANTITRAYVARVTQNPFIDDPVATMKDSLWLPLVVAVIVGAALATAVICVRRRHHRKRPAA